MKRMNKRGMEHVLVMQILAIASLLILVGIIPLRAGQLLNGEDKDLALCRTTLLGEGLGDAFDLTNNFNAICTTQQKTLPERGGTTKEGLNELAIHMARAWWATGEGNIDNLWGKDGVLDKLSPLQFRDGEGCFILYIVDWDAAEIEKLDFETFLRTETFREVYDEQKKEDVPITYADYFQLEQYGSGGGTFKVLPTKGSRSNDPEEITDSISTDYTYAISVRSPTSADKGSNVVMFSSLTYAERYGCFGSNTINVRGPVA